MFDRLQGNGPIKELLRHMLAHGRVPHALIFAGESGVGKKEFAIELAAALNCPERTPTGEACDRCSSCTRIMSWPTENQNENRIIWSMHPDVGLIRPPGRFILVEQARELAREANLNPYEGAARTFIIDEADKLNEAASNALLKTLEEMPHTSYIILVTERIAALLPTVLSRCQKLRFAPLSSEELAPLIQREKRVSAEEARTIARLARGSAGRALRMDWEEERARRERALAILEAALAEDRARLLRLAEELSEAAHKEDLEPTLDWLMLLARDAWLFGAGADEQIINTDLRARLERIAARATASRLVRWIEKIDEIRRHLSVNINRRIASDALLLAMASG
ncbi:MAG: hypothetical protein IRZ19_10415 [Pyrinomonas methylaliphatogenes]|nr:hypothetical protein [Pyrinomonas methylaliphatogenes]